MRMRCPSCRTANPEEARFCMTCGASLREQAVTSSSVQAVEEARGGSAVAQGKPQAAPRRVAALVGIAGLVAVGGLVPFLLLGGKGCSSTEGSMQLAGEPWGEHEIVPVACKSGQHMQFFGVALFSDMEQDPDVIAVSDPVRGDVIRLQPRASGCGGACPAVSVTPGECKVFELAVERTNTTVNDIRLLDGRLELDCELASGARVKGRVDFRSCD